MKNPGDANVIITSSYGFKTLSEKHKRTKDIFVERAEWLDTCIRSGKFEHSVEAKRSKNVPFHQ